MHVEKIGKAKIYVGFWLKVLNHATDLTSSIESFGDISTVSSLNTVRGHRLVPFF